MKELRELIADFRDLNEQWFITGFRPEGLDDLFERIIAIDPNFKPSELYNCI